METFLVTVKFFAILSSGVWGAVGLLVDYKDTDGRITKWGRRALIGVVFSTIVATAAQAVETYQQRRASEKDAEETRTMLLEMRKALYPIDDISVQLRVELPLNVPGLKEYWNRIRKATAPLVAPEGGWERTSSVTLPRMLWPHQKKEPSAWRLVIQ